MSDRDLTFLEHKDSDSPAMRSLKSYWQVVMDMPEPERKVFLQEERIKQEESYLQEMINQNYSDDDFITMAIHKTKSALIDYDIFKDTTLLEAAELWAAIAQSTKAKRFTIADIRKQRERIQWEKKKLK